MIPPRRTLPAALAAAAIGLAAPPARATSLEMLPSSSVTIEADPAPAARAGCAAPLRIRNRNDSEVVVEYVVRAAGGPGCAVRSMLPGSMRLRREGVAGSTRPLGCPIRTAPDAGCRERRSWSITFVGRYG